MDQPNRAADSASREDRRNPDRENVPPGLVCSVCQSKLIRRSMRRTFKDRLMSLAGKWPYRCEMCNERFYGPQDPESVARAKAHGEHDAPNDGPPKD